MVNCINLIIELSPGFILGRENVPCVAEVVNRSLKADCTDFTFVGFLGCIVGLGFLKFSGEYQQGEQNHHSVVQISFYLLPGMISVFSLEQLLLFATGHNLHGNFAYLAFL